MSRNLSRVLPLLLIAVLLVVGQPSHSKAQDKTVFKVWYYEAADSAMGISWAFAQEKFEEAHPDVEVQFELKVFEQIQQSAVQILNSDEAPDLMEVNKGNGTAGIYSSQGLLTDLTAVAEERGWTEIMSPSIQTTCRYENGIMGSGNLYGVTTYGEFVMVYYNKDMFAEYGLEVPTTLDEFNAVADAFLAEDVTPMSIGALSVWPVTQNFYELVLYNADRDLINNYQLLQGDLDFHSEAFTFGTEAFLEQVEKGYYGDNASGTAYEDANAAFIQGDVPMTLTGSWMFGSFLTGITDFDWGLFTMPGKQYNTGSGGNLWIVPENAKNKELAYDFIDLTLTPEAQTVMANAGGIPINADLSQITDENIKELNTAFSNIVANDGLAFYPDWPTPDFMDTLGSGLQELIAGSMSPSDFLDYIGDAYEGYKGSLQ